MSASHQGQCLGTHWGVPNLLTSWCGLMRIAHFSYLKLPPKHLLSRLPEKKIKNKKKKEKKKTICYLSNLTPIFFLTLKPLSSSCTPTPRRKGLEWDCCRRGLGGVVVEERVDSDLVGEQIGSGS